MAIDSWHAAEEMAARHMQFLGFRDAHVVGGGGPDGGLDVRAEGAAAQVKHHARPVGGPLVQQLRGAVGFVDHAIFYSLSGYTSAAYAAAESGKVALFTYGGDGSIHAENGPASTLEESATHAFDDDEAPFDVSRFLREHDLWERIDLIRQVGREPFAEIRGIADRLRYPPPQEVIERLGTALGLALEMVHGGMESAAAEVRALQVSPRQHRDFWKSHSDLEIQVDQLLGTRLSVRESINAALNLEHQWNRYLDKADALLVQAAPQEEVIWFRGDEARELLAPRVPLDIPGLTLGHEPLERLGSSLLELLGQKYGWLAPDGAQRESVTSACCYAQASIYAAAHDLLRLGDVDAGADAPPAGSLDISHATDSLRTVLDIHLSMVWNIVDEADARKIAGELTPAWSCLIENLADVPEGMNAEIVERAASSTEDAYRALVDLLQMLAQSSSQGLKDVRTLDTRVTQSIAGMRNQIRDRLALITAESTDVDTMTTREAQALLAELTRLEQIRITENYQPPELTVMFKAQAALGLRARIYAVVHD